MLIIEYQSNGKAFSDFNVIETAEQIVKDYLKNESKDLLIQVSTFNLIDSISLLVCRKIIKGKEIKIVFNNQEIYYIDNKFNLGQLESYPAEFGDLQSKIYHEMWKLRKKECEKITKLDIV